MSARYVVIGAGISGLSAAWALITARPDADVSVLEASRRVGGKIQRGVMPATGLDIDVGAESLLARRPEGIDLIDAIGLSADLVHPRTSTASIVSRGTWHPMPARTLMGIPTDVHTLHGVLNTAEVRRAEHEVVAPGSSADISLGDLVSARLGDAVVDRVIEPLLGGVYAGHSRHISAAAALPVAYAAHRDGIPLVDAARRALPAPSAKLPPVFAGLRGGLHSLPTHLARELTHRGVRIRTGVTVRQAHRNPAGFTLVCAVTSEPKIVEADALIVALPPAPAARLLTDVAPRAATGLRGIQMASMAIVTMALPSAQMPTMTGSGVLVPPVEGRTVKAATFSARKWGWVGAEGIGRGPGGTDLELIRASVGRQGEEAVLQRDDADLVALVISDLRAMGLGVPDPAEVHVQRWGGALPQYAPGHLRLVTGIRAAVAEVPALGVAGASYDGVGIPACIASGQTAAQQITR